MARTARFVMVGVVHHVVARGVNRERIFCSDEEKQKYLARFALVAKAEEVIVHGYCLMDNHVHFIVTPTSPKGLARLFQRVHTWWAIVFNRAHQRTGHLFQNRFYSSPMSESRYWRALRYVELNPTRAGLVEKAEDFRFSSALAHCTDLAVSPICLKPVSTVTHFTPDAWREYLAEKDTRIGDDLRRALAGSRPVGDPDWLAALSKQANRHLAWRPPGRPKRETISQSAAN